MNKAISVFVVLWVLFVGGCGSSSYLLDAPRKFESCTSMGANPRQKSFDTIWDLVNRMHGWRIDEVYKQKYMIEATVYRGNAFIPMMISVNKDAAVEIIRDPNIPREISVKWGATLKRWIDNLEARYSQKRCG